METGPVHRQSIMLTEDEIEEAQEELELQDGEGEALDAQSVTESIQEELEEEEEQEKAEEAEVGGGGTTEEEQEEEEQQQGEVQEEQDDEKEEEEQQDEEEAEEEQVVTDVTEVIEEEEGVYDKVLVEQEKLIVSFEIRTPSGKKFHMNNLNRETTIFEVKQMIAEQDDNYQVHVIKLIKTGKVLSADEQTLQEAGITNGSIVHMVKKLGGPQRKYDPTSSKVGVDLKTTDARDRGFLTIRIPANARAGTKLILNPPGRTERLYVTVPQGYRPGDALRVRLPEERNESPFPVAQGASSRRSNTGQEATVAPNVSRTAPRGGIGGQKFSDLMKIVCPESAIPGMDLQVEVPGQGRMKVKVPETMNPGDILYFRLLES